jgi:5-methylcytosine-specific restriction endonuclease McrA
MDNLIKQCSQCESENIEYKESIGQYGYFCNDCKKIEVFDFSKIGKCCRNSDPQVYELELSNGTINYRFVCNNCHDNTKSIKKDLALSIGIFAKAKLSDINELKYKNYQYNLYSEFHKLKQELISIVIEKRNEEFEKKRIEHTEKYHEYLRTEKWKGKREKVLKRDNNLCQACLINKATEVHHKTYEKIFDEPLFDLVSLCHPCHSKLHDKTIHNGL